VHRPRVDPGRQHIHPAYLPGPTRTAPILVHLTCAVAATPATGRSARIHLVAPTNRHPDAPARGSDSLTRAGRLTTWPIGSIEFREIRP
jgi:hypothetical protein